MNTKYLMTSSAIATGFPGMILSFFPEEILNYVGITSNEGLATLFIKITGGLYLGFAIMNWMAKTVLIEAYMHDHLPWEIVCTLKLLHLRS